MTLELLMLMLALGAGLSLMYYWLTRPDPMPTSLEEEITRKAIAKISWRRRPPLAKTKSGPFNPGNPEQGILVTIPFDHSKGVRILFAEGRAQIPPTNIELAAPDSIDRLAKAIEHEWASQYR